MSYYTADVLFSQVFCCKILLFLFLQYFNRFLNKKTNKLNLFYEKSSTYSFIYKSIS